MAQGEAPVTKGDDVSDDPDLAALLGSRICHDLISPLGAIGNGVELLMLEGGAARPEVALIAQSVASAQARIRFLRVAFGAPGSEQRMGRPEILGLLRDWTEGGRLTVDWQVTGDLPRAEVRRAFLALLCLESALPFGGTIRVGREGLVWRAHAAGRRLKVDPGLWALLTDAAAAQVLTAPQVQFGLLRRELLNGPGPARVDAGETALDLAWGPGAA
jgi:histidine phosphotransferase ChpT